MLFSLLSFFSGFFLLAAQVGMAQVRPIIKRVKLQHIGIEHGLSQGLVNLIAQDHRGFIWMATKDGLNRYDGNQFKVYRHIPDDTLSLSENNIHTLTVDKRGLIWISYFDRNVDVFDPETEKTYRLSGQINKLRLSNSAFKNLYAIPLASGQVILTDSHHWLLVEIKENRNEKSFGYTLKLENHSRFLPFPPPKNPPWFCYFVSQNQNLYLSSGDSVWVFAHPDLRRKPSFIKHHYTRFAPERPSSSDPIAAKEPVQILAEDTILKRFCLRHDFGGKYYVYDIKNQRVVSSLNQGKNDFGSARFGPDGNVWIGTYLGPIRWNVKENEAALIRPKNPEIGDDQLMQGETWFDKSGQAWIGTYGFGVFKFNPKEDRFHHATFMPAGGFSVNEMVEDPAKNQLWLTYQNQLYRYDLNTGEIRGKPKMRYAKGENILAHKDGFRDSFFYQSPLLPDGKGYWAAWKNQVCQLDLDFNVLKKPFLATDTKGWKHHLAMGNHGEVWMARTDPLEIYKFDGFGKSGIKKVTTPGLESNSRMQLVSSMLVDADDQLWLATTQGLVRVDGKTQGWEKYAPKPNGLPGKMLFSIHQDLAQKHILWIGTNGNGLVKFDKQTGFCQTFHSKNTAIPNDVIYGVLEDKAGNLWLSTNQGLARFNPKTLAVKVFTEKDGLQSNEFNRYAFCKLSDGRLAFGGINGINVFNPEQIKDNNFKPTVFFTGFKIGNKTVWGDSSQMVLEREIFAMKELHLNYNQNYFTFQYASTDYTRPTTNHYQYQLVGLDTAWQPATTLNEATYTNLSPGEYNFRVRAANSEGVWSANEANMAIFISPPWWGTWWFRTLAVLSFGGMLYGFYRYRLAQELKIIRLRDKIALDLHDEIGSTLSSISLFGEAARRMLPEDHQVNQVLNRINSDTKNMMESMSDIVWSINSRNDRFDNLVNRIRAFVVQVMEAKGAKVDFQVSENLNEINLNMEQRKNLFLLIKEVVNNAAKYSSCNQLIIKLTFEHHQIHLSIEDDGKGFDLNSVQNGNGLVNMKKRADDLNASFRIDSKIGKGTSIEVVFLSKYH